MRVRIAISDPLPVFRHGVMAVLREAGFESEMPDDLLAWVRDEQLKVVLMTVRTAEDWTLLRDLHRTAAGAVLLAVLDDVSVHSYVRALLAGAVGAVPRDGTPAVIRDAFRAAVNGQSLVPIEVLRALTNRPIDPPDDGQPTEAEREWLRHLSNGMTVNRLAAQAGYSERMMFRLLRDLYTRLGARDRVDALLRARARGWL